MMDIKSMILIGGGILIAAVLAHGFWVAWRARREPLRIDIVPDLNSGPVDDMERLRAELPNGGARIVTKPRSKQTESADAGSASIPAGAGTDSDADVALGVTRELFGDAIVTQPNDRATGGRSGRQDKEPARTRDEPVRATAAKASRARVMDVDVSSRNGKSADTREMKAVPHQLVVVYVLANRNRPFTGEGLVKCLRSCGLKYGDMNIFHRMDEATKDTLYSVASAVEPGTFDLSDIEAIAVPGLTFFMQLPGPDDALGAFEEMITTARTLARELGGELKDEQHSAFTVQTIAHYRQRITEDSRRRLSRRA